MIRYYQCRNILIDGSSLEGSWLTRTLGYNTQGRMSASNWESSVFNVLKQLMTKRADVREIMGDKNMQELVIK